MYFFAGIYKLITPIWQQGEALFYIMRIEDFKSSHLNIVLTENYYFVKGFTYLTIIWELFYFIFFLIKRVRIPLILFSVTMHLGILFFMRVDNFSLVMLSIYPSLLSDKEINSILDKVWKIIPLRDTVHKFFRS